jgi:two-component sensor histidine kinase
VLLIFSAATAWMAWGRVGLPRGPGIWLSGVAIAILAAGLVLQSLRWRALSHEQTRRHLRALEQLTEISTSNGDLYKRMADAMRNQQRLYERREAIFAVNAAIYQASTLPESLQIIAELAPGALDVDLCMVTLNGGGDGGGDGGSDDNDDRAVIAAVTKPHGEEFVGKTLLPKGTHGEIVRSTRRMLVIEDAKTHPGTHPAIRDRLNAGSIVYLPMLRTDGRAMGTLLLIRHAPGPFLPEQLNLAEMFTSRASAAVENAQLLDQTRRDASTKAMLLRELNHRVKNNLASIIALLSLDEPDMSPTARQWLRRAIDRIRTMARTHDLFAGGIHRVALSELVGQVIPSLSVVKPPAVEIRMDLSGADVLLRTDRAVSLAMALHELCSNAILHGTGNAGIITIRAGLSRLQKSRANGSKVVGNVMLEVIDLGRHPSIRPEPQQERVGAGGLGLILVEGLVTSELGGSFSLVRSDAGGSAARIQFPVGDEELGQAGPG